jgi:hypothetical protein
MLNRCWYVLDKVLRTIRGMMNRVDVVETCKRLTPISFVGLIRESAEK